ncbi:hypothetical protein ABZ746_30820 [Streptomyces sp. NPDC020096]
MAALRAAICELVEAAQPCSVRQAYYLGIGLLWDKDMGHSRRNYSVVVREVGQLREPGRLPWEWITDGTRRIAQQIAYEEEQRRALADLRGGWGAAGGMSV